MSHSATNREVELNVGIIYRGIRLLSVAGKVYGKVVVEQVQITEIRIGKEQRGFRKCSGSDFLTQGGS